MATDETSGLRAAGFYLGVFLVVYCGGAFFMPILLLVNFCVSLALIAQSLISGSSLSRNGWLGGRLADVLVRTQDLIHMGIGAWAGLVHLSLFFPMSMIIAFVLPSYFALPKKVQNAVLSLPKHLRLQRSTKHVDSIEKVIIWLGRSFMDHLLSMGSHAGAMISRFIAPLSSSTCYTILWWAINSAVVDYLVLHSMKIGTRILYVLRWVQSIIAVTVIAPGLYFGSDLTSPILTFFSLQLLIWPAPVGFLVYFMDRLKKAASELDSQEYSDKQRGNASIYATLMVKEPEAETSSITRHSTLVRLLIIEPGSREQKIHCRLKVADLAFADKLQYEALSYVWGPPDLAKTIEINYNTFAVSTALFQALIHLRYNREPRTIWIDAISINQVDLAERSTQVLLMQDIYSKASRVVVWLGEVEPWGLKYLLEAADTAVEGENFIHYGAVNVVSNLLRRPWWARVWVIQELVLARDVTVYCGSQALGWDRFCLVVNSSTSLPSFPSSGVYIDEFRALRDNWKARVYLSSTGEPEPIDSDESGQRDARATDMLSLIYDFRSRRTTDPRDKVFAFQGLAQALDSRPLIARQPFNLAMLLVRPDYARRNSFICIDLARRHIRRTRSLSIMALAECARQTYPSIPDTTNDNREQYLPSWCPALMNIEAIDKGLRFRPFWTGLPSEGDEHFSAAGRVPLQALPPEPSDFKVPSGWEHLDFDGYSSYGGYPHKLDIQVLTQLCDTIVEAGPVAGGSMSKLVNSTMKVISRQQSTMLNSFRGRNSWDSMLPNWRRMALEAHRSRKSRSAEMEFEEEFQLTITAGKFSAVPRSTDQQGNHASPLFADASTTAMGYQAYLAAREDTCANRVMFVTPGGRFGIGPPDLLVGDEVCVVLGIQVPVVLRKVGEVRDGCVQYNADDWLFVGQVYLHQRMVYQGDLAKNIRDFKVAIESRVLT